MHSAAGASRAEAAVNPASQRQVVVGRITGVYGVRGWLRVASFTEPAANILRYEPWIVRQGEAATEHRVLEGRLHRRGVVVHLDGVADREAASELTGAEVRVTRDQFTMPGEGQYYWADLVGLQVVNSEGEVLGIVDHLLETGANDVLVVCGERRRMLPYLPGRVVREVDLKAGVIRVDWARDF
jgi:16S rRNA processing protein RimM